MTEETKQKIQKIARYYGYDAQSRQCIEEMAELTQAINKFWRKQLDCGRKPIKEGYIPTLSKEWENMVEEIADVQIMLWQLEYLIGCDVDYCAIPKKLNRQMERIERE